MSEVLLRKDVPAQAQWQTSHIYASQEDWEKDFQWIQEKARELASYAGTLKNGKDVVLSLLKTYAESSEHLSRLYTYASCNLNVDNGDSFQQGVMARAQSLYAQYSAAVAFLSPELLKLPKATLKGYIADPDFGDFDVFLKDLERMRPHTLSSEVETLLASGQEVFGATGNVYDMLTDVDMSLGKVKGEDGKMVELTHARYGSMLESPDRSVRKAAYERMMKAYGAYGSTFAATYAGNVKSDVFMAKAHGYQSAREAALYPDDIPVSVYDNLLKAVHEALPVLHAYCGMRKEAFNIPTVHMYDLYAPMTKDFQMKLTFDEAYELLLEYENSEYAPLLRMLGMCLYGSEGVAVLKIDYPKALELFSRASDLGDAPAMACLGNMYASAIAAELDRDKAEELYAQAAPAMEEYIAANPEAEDLTLYLITLGDVYGISEDLKDESKVHEYYSQAAELGTRRRPRPGADDGFIELCQKRQRRVSKAFIRQAKADTGKVNLTEAMSAAGASMASVL